RHTRLVSDWSSDVCSSDLYAGHLADAISKRTVLIAVKMFEIAVMALGIVVFFSQSVPLMFTVLFLMAVHYTVFSPAKYSIVPERSEERRVGKDETYMRRAE